MLSQLFRPAIQHAATGWNGNASWLQGPILMALTGLIILIVLAVQAVRRRTWTSPEPASPRTSPMYDPWIDGYYY